MFCSDVSPHVSSGDEKMLRKSTASRNHKETDPMCWSCDLLIGRSHDQPDVFLRLSHLYFEPGLFMSSSSRVSMAIGLHTWFPCELPFGPKTLLTCGSCSWRPPGQVRRAEATGETPLATTRCFQVTPNLPELASHLLPSELLTRLTSRGGQRSGRGAH